MRIVGVLHRKTTIPGGGSWLANLNARDLEAIYERYVMPVEHDHAGKYVAVAPDGRMLFGQDLHEVIAKASRTFGPGNYIYRVGERAVGNWR
jgi:hypothetical protein